MYRIRLMEKTAERDSYNEGCIGDARSTMRPDDLRPVTAETLQDAIGRMFRSLGLPTDYFFVPNHEMPDAPYVTVNRQEDDNGDEPNEDTLSRFRAGEITLWLATYVFELQWIDVRPVTKAELRAAFPEAEIEA